MTENEQQQPVDLGLDKETEEAMGRASDDEIIKFVGQIFEVVQDSLLKANAAVHTLAARVDTLESFVGHLVEKDPELCKKLKEAREAAEKYGDVAKQQDLGGQMLRSLSETPEEEQQVLLDQLKSSGAVPQDAELMNTKDGNESGDKD